MMMKFFLTFLSIAIVSSTLAQYNKTDDQGRKQGTWKKAYPGSTVFKYVGQFKDDKPYGKFVYYYESGAVKAVLKYRDPITADAQLYHESSYMMARGKYVSREKDSSWVFYDDRGIISYQEDYKKGKLHGQRVVYYQPVDGEYRVMKYSYWKNGKRHGEYKEYHPSTKVKEEGKYVDGKRHGKVFNYFPNGKKSRVEQFKNGLRHGYQIRYNEKGQQESYKLYWDGKELKGKALKEKEAELRANR